MRLAPASRPLRRAAAGLVIAACLFAALAWSSPAQPLPAPAHAAATCADFADQAAAQRAADTRDPDGDGIYCESLPCPCLAPGPSQAPPTPSPAPSTPFQPTSTSTCTKPAGIQPISFSKTKYPHIRAHFRAALRRGWPRTLVLKRPRRRRPPRTAAARHPYPRRL